jgi:hypothetical protein
MSEPPSWRSRWPWLASAVTLIAAGVTLGNRPHPSTCGDARVAWSGRTGELSWYQGYGICYDTIQLAVAHNPPLDRCASTQSLAY